MREKRVSIGKKTTGMNSIDCADTYAFSLS